MENNFSVYLNDENLKILDTLAKEAGGRSQAIAKLIEEKKPVGNTFSVTVAFYYSQKFREERALAGLPAFKEGTVKFNGTLIKELKDFAEIEENSALVDMRKKRWYFRKNDFRQDLFFPQFDKAPASQEEAYQMLCDQFFFRDSPEVIKFLSEEKEKEKAREKEAEKTAAQNRELRKELEEKKESESKRKKEQLKNAISWAEKNGSELLNARIRNKFNWGNLCAEEYAISLFKTRLPGYVWEKIDSSDEKRTFEKHPHLDSLRVFEKIDKELKEEKEGDLNFNWEMDVEQIADPDTDTDLEKVYFKFVLENVGTAEFYFLA